jgi:hypothetical protein
MIQKEVAAAGYEQHRLFLTDFPGIFCFAANCLLWIKDGGPLDNTRIPSHYPTSKSTPTISFFSLVNNEDFELIKPVTRKFNTIFSYSQKINTL